MVVEGTNRQAGEVCKIMIDAKGLCRCGELNRAGNRGSIWRDRNEWRARPLRHGGLYMCMM
jgi:hypothetical protein